MSSHTVEFVVPDECDVEPSGETVAMEVHEDQYLLAAARSNGLWLPADCQMGWCTVCAARLLEGEVDQSDARRYYDEDREADLVLTCVARPRSDLRLRVCQEESMLNHRSDFGLPPGRSKR
ncbi:MULTISPECIES: 2Fe-2S iron-sulfur cluster-binding protein [Halostella]|uniref:2Fe-2S iron-sulfur cluster-binding protein n=1 Tax=Halostella TaxID=1843185 RepID=UPI0010805922|nr:MULTISPECIES: 2Fe-2S iron-sulfur cluster-binding protein [Halostella]